MFSVKCFRLAHMSILMSMCVLSLNGAAYPDKPIQRSIPGATVLDYSAMVVPQKGPDCGLHALKNSLILYRYLIGSITEQERNKQLQSESIGKIPTMAACRVQLEGQQGSLQPEALYEIAKRVKAPFNKAYVDERLLILDNLNDTGLMRPTYQTKQLARVVEALHSGDPFIQAFVLGNMDQVTKKSGHWSAGVLIRSCPGGALFLHMADSAGSKNISFDIAVGTKLIDFLNSLLYEPIKVKSLKFGAIQLLFASLENNLWFNNYKAALTNISDIIEEAREQQVFNDPDFKVDRLLDVLDNMPDSLAVEDKALRDILYDQLLSREQEYFCDFGAQAAQSTSQQNQQEEEGDQEFVEQDDEGLLLAQQLSKESYRQEAAQRTQPSAATVQQPPVTPQRAQVTKPSAAAVPQPRVTASAVAAMSDAELDAVYKRAARNARAIKDDKHLLPRIASMAAKGNKKAQDIMRYVQSVK